MFPARPPPCPGFTCGASVGGGGGGGGAAAGCLMPVGSNKGQPCPDACIPRVLRAAGRRGDLGASSRPNLPLPLRAEAQRCPRRPDPASRAPRPALRPPASGAPPATPRVSVLFCCKSSCRVLAWGWVLFIKILLILLALRPASIPLARGRPGSLDAFPPAPPQSSETRGHSRPSSRAMVSMSAPPSSSPSPCSSAWSRGGGAGGRSRAGS